MVIARMLIRGGLLTLALTAGMATARPSVLEALRLMTKSNFVGCKTGRSPVLSPQRIGTETLVSATCVTAAPLRYANNVATNPQAAANISQSPATARLSVAWIK
jgi:hypothetical protein